ncbi:MAG: EAL domain-containing protein [Thermoanaerobaculum sp.]|nr:EAL domain-containing protein [Thermoanaerobaculum sp.]MDW7968630.1 EAL domain-containing protein [Thermoanaerobaculum sp.]
MNAFCETPREEFSVRHNWQKILQAVASLLAGAPVEDSLALLGEGTGADRVYVFCVHPHPETQVPACTQLWEWCAPGVEPQKNNPALKNLPVREAGFGRWLEELGAGRAVVGDVNTFPPSERPLLEAQGIQSILVVPVFRDGKPWGFVGFDAVKSPRRWQESEREVLQTVAAAIGDQLKLQEAMAELQRTEERWRTLLEHIPDAIVVHDGTQVLYANPAANLLFGVTSPEGLAGRRGTEIIHGASWPLVQQRVAAMLREGEPAPALELAYTRSDGTVFLAETRSVPTFFGKRRVIVSVLRDLGERKRWLEQIQHLAYHDGLTDLPNRRLLRERAEQLLALARRHKFPVALGYLDLDRFKEVNDALGHDAGDELLQAVALRLSRAARETDTVARLGGDEFAILWPQTGHEGARVAARRVLDCFSQPFILRQEVLSVEASLGIAVYPGDGASLDELMRAADVAMYRAKGERSGFAFYSPEMDRYSRARLAFLEQLKRALRSEGVHFFFQPILTAAEGRLVMAETLARFVHADQVVQASSFVPLLQEVGLLPELDGLALKVAAQAAARLGVPVSVNVAAPTLQMEGFLQHLEEVLVRNSLAPQQLWLEITESALLPAVEQTAEKLRRARSMGIHVVLDDFGTAYSSLALLRDVPAELVKLDASFVRAAARDSRGEALLHGVVDLVHRLGVKVVAEGVEGAAEHQLACRAGCDLVQGFGFAPALPVEDERWAVLRGGRG